MNSAAWIALLALSAPPVPQPVLAVHAPKRVDKAELDELERDNLRFRNEAGEYLDDAQRLIENRYAKERDRKGDYYERRLLNLEKEERTERLDAIAVLERFLERFPAEERATPPVMFRLAELYFERSSDEHLVAMRAYEEAVRKLDPKSGAEPPAEPKVDFRPSIETYEALHTRFPDFEHSDATWYLLGYCLDKQGDGEKALAAYRQVVERYPTSKFTTEAWLRIGESYFDNPEKKSALALATYAYEQAVRNKGHPLYDKVLYKLGWTYYLTDRFDEAVERFFDLLEYYARPDARVGGDLKEEALQYMAISLSDERTGQLGRARALFEKRGHRPWEAELYRRMGDIWLDRSNNKDALSAFEAAIAAAPAAKDVPSIHQRIIETYRREQRWGEALAEAERLTKLVSNNSAWLRAWAQSAEVLGNANAIAERTLSQVAIAQHQLAIAKLRANADARADFASAAKGYRAYLAAFPRSKQAYELEYYLADCLYGAEQYKEATAVYQSVRDSIAGTAHKKDAAWATVLGVQKQLEIARASAAALPVKTSRDFAEAPAPEAIPLAPLERAFVTASDAFVAEVPANDQRAANVAYQAGELYFTHFDFEPARQRFEALIARAPQSSVAPFASNLIIESYLIAKNWKAVEEVAARLSRNKNLAAPDASLFSELTKFKLGGRFKLAESLMAEAKFAEAAAKYIELVDESPKHEFADKALNNAAICQENLKRFDSALKLYERIARDYPNSPLADGASFRVALNAQKSYDFPKAIEEYQRLVRSYPKSKEVEPALYNTARLLEGLQRYGEAAAAYARVASAFPDSKDAPQNAFRAALAYAQQQAFPQEIAALERFIKSYGTRPEQNELTIDAYRRIGEARQKLKDAPGAKRAFQSALAEFDKRGLKPDKAPIAAEAAAMSSFSLAESAFAQFDALAISGSKKALAQAFLNKKNALKAANDAYDVVVKYKRTSWTIAAFYRKGYLLERFAQTIVDAGANPPPEVKQLGEEAVVSYQDQLSAQTVALEDKAVETYVAALGQARALRVSNLWTRRILESLHRFRPKEYPSLMETKTLLAVDKPYSLGLVPEAGLATSAAQEALRANAPEAWEALARFSCRVKSCEAFVDQAKKRAADAPAAVGPRIGLAYALLHLGRDEEAATAAKAALAIDERQPTAMRILATTFLKARKWMLARMVLEAARELEPKDASIHRALGFLYDALDERTKAIDSFARASALAPLSPEARAGNGAILVKNEDFAAALPELEAALAAEPSDIEARLNLGNALLGLKRIPEAIVAYEAVVKASPAVAETYFNLGAVYLENEIPNVSTVERLRAAQGYFERYRSSGGRDDHLDEYLREVTKALQKEERRLEREKKKGTPKVEASLKGE